MDNLILFERTTSSVNYAHVDFDNKDMVILNPYDLIKDRVNKFPSLLQNWDGYGGIATLKTISDKTCVLLMMLNSLYIESISDLFPNPNGTLTIDWENFKNEKVSLEIGETNFSFFVKYANKEPKFVNGEDIINDFKSLTEALGELFGNTIFNVIP